MRRRANLAQPVDRDEPFRHPERWPVMEDQRGMTEAKRAAAVDPVAKILLAAAGAPTLEQFQSAVDGENATVLLASDGVEALARWWAEDPDLLVIDASLPPFTGFDVCRAIREASETPVVIVTSDGGDEIVVRGLDCGADDVVSPPLRTTLFRLRLRAVINRYRAARLDAAVAHPRSVDRAPALTIGRVTIDADSRVVTDGIVGVRLTLCELRILELLARNPGVTIPFRRLFEHAWGFPGDGVVHRVTLRRYVMRIRKKLRPLGEETTWIDSTRGIGYFVPTQLNVRSSVAHLN